MRIARAALQECGETTRGNRRVGEGYRFNNAALLCLEGRYAEALPIIRSIDPEAVAAGTKTVLLNNEALCQVFIGDAAEAVRLASAAVTQARTERAGSLRMAALLGTLGVALLKSEHSDEAVSALEKANALAPQDGLAVRGGSSSWARRTNPWAISWPPVTPMSALSL